MRLLIFDTETTGLPLSRTPARQRANNWPHLVSIAWTIIDNNVIVKQRHYLIKPIYWTIPEESTKIHGITNYMANTNGAELDHVMTEFLAEDYDAMVAHNIDFDENVIENAIIWDLQKNFSGFKGEKKCTMTLSRPVCKLPARIGYKMPKLSELYYFIFKRHPASTSLHSALYDTTILTECIQHADWLRHLVTPSSVTNNGDKIVKELSFNFAAT